MLVDSSGKESYPDYWRIKDKYGWGVANKSVHYANLALSMANNYAYSHGLDSTWNNEADAYRHFMWNAMLTRHVGYYEARFITNLHEYMAMEDYGWLDDSTRFTTYNSPWVYGRMNQEMFMDLWNNQVGRELANNSDFSHMNGDELFEMALQNGWLVTDASNTFEFLGISDCISDFNDYTVDVAWNQDTGNIIVYKDGAEYVTLKIGE